MSSPAETCAYCALMGSMRLPDHYVEVASIAFNECQADTVQFTEWVNGRLAATDHNQVGGSWSQYTYVRWEHIHFHDHHGTTCVRYEQLCELLRSDGWDQCGNCGTWFKPAEGAPEGVCVACAPQAVNAMADSAGELSDIA